MYRRSLLAPMVTIVGTKLGGGGGIRTPEAYALRFSRPPPSTTRPPPHVPAAAVILPPLQVADHPSDSLSVSAPTAPRHRKAPSPVGEGAGGEVATAAGSCPAVPRR